MAATENLVGGVNRATMALSTPTDSGYTEGTASEGQPSSMTNPPILEIRNLSFTYPGYNMPALDDVSLTLCQGQLTGLVGPNGAGKSTLLGLIAGTLQIHRGAIEVSDSLTREDRSKIAYVPQRDNINWNVPLSIYDVVMMGRYPYLKRLRPSSQSDRTIVQQALERLQIDDIANKRVRHLSGGQKQRVIMARALAQQAHVLLLDEPLNGLDRPTQEIILDVLKSLMKQQITALVSIHDLSLLDPHFDRVIFLDRTIVADGPTNEVLNINTLERVYGVKLQLPAAGQQS